MSEKQTDTNWVRDGIGLVLFAAFAFLGVLVVMAWAQPPLFPDQEGPAFLMRPIGYLGEPALLALCLGLVWLGFRLFMGQVPPRLARLWITLAALVPGLSIVLGAAWPDHGGSLGHAATGLLTPWPAAGFGLLVIGLPLWRLWIGPTPAGSPAGEDPGRVLGPDTRSGLSIAEAQALLPEKLLRPLVVPSPYPPDVRKEGRIPEGARPIPPDDGSTTQQVPLEPLPVSGAAQGKPAPGQPPDPDLAGGWSAAALEGGRPGRSGGAQPGPAPSLGASARGRPLADEAPAAVPSPGWEQPELFEEEPVDAYGTPISLVETLREDTVGETEVPKTATEVKPELDMEVLTTAEETADVAAEVWSKLDLDEDALDRETLDRETGKRKESLAGGQHAGEEEYEEEESDEDDDEYEEEEDEDEDEDDEYEEESDEDDEFEDYDGYEEEEEVGARQQTVGAEREPEVEIVPQPARNPRRAREPKPAPAPARSAESEDDLVFRAGALILARERVAVSLLQREFHLDFEQATHILDCLQDAGLIGPYVGGQRRDILLTAEEWQEKRVGSS